MVSVGFLEISEGAGCFVVIVVSPGLDSPLGKDPSGWVSLPQPERGGFRGSPLALGHLKDQMTPQRSPAWRSWLSG